MVLCSRSAAGCFWKIVAMILVRGFYVQLQVIHALLLREIMTRFGAHKLGYLWAIIEPLAFIGTFAVMFSLGNRKIPNGMDSVSFLTTGIIPFLLFRQTLDRSIKAISANKALLFYPQIRPLDLVIARSTLEIATLTTIFVTILIFNSLFNQPLMMDSLLRVMLGLTLAGLLGASLGLIICSLSVYSNMVERIVGPLFRPLFWISGLFFSANELPSAIREIFMWNPILHAVEVTRDGIYSSYHAKYFNPWYVIMWILAFSFIGLTLERTARRQLDVT